MTLNVQFAENNNKLGVCYLAQPVTLRLHSITRVEQGVELPNMLNDKIKENIKNRLIADSWMPDEAEREVEGNAWLIDMVIDEIMNKF